MVTEKKEQAIKVEQLNFAYGPRPILTDVQFTIPEGDYVGIIGPNGGGKTTLLRLLMGLEKPNSGTVELFSRPAEKARSCVGYVPQALHFDRSFPISTLELVLGGRLSHLPWHGRFSKKDREIALSALDQVRLSNRADHQFGSLSGGQRQRALIARALAGEPRLLFLDEPTANVDIESEGELYALIDTLRGDKTILMVTHNLQATVEKVDSVLCVEQKVSFLDPKKICEHFAIGLYHHPLIESDCCLPSKEKEES